ncbi:MAG: carboxypeptidase-like regulatory domain-containing protein [Bacteroidota bacterium]
MRLLFVLAAVIAFPAAAQPVRVPVAPSPHAATFVATVLDSETGEPLPGATAQIIDTTLGTTADREGRLSLELATLPTTVIVRYVGYASAQITLTDADVEDGVIERVVRLSVAPFIGGEVVVSAEPPGERIWRRVLARKAELGRRVGKVYGEAYTRMILRRDGPLDVRPVPIRIEESLSNLGWEWGGGAREEVVARRRLPDGGPFRWARLDPIPDLYFEDVMLLDRRPVMSPTHPQSIDHYAFRLGETVEAEGRRFLEIAVIPRRGGLLRGRIRIVDSLFVIASAELRAEPDRRGGVDDFQAAYEWTFTPAEGHPTLGDSLWLPSEYLREGSVSPTTRVPRVRFRQRSWLTLRVPGVLLPIDTRARRYRNPVGVYGGRESFQAVRDAFPLDDLEVAADTLSLLRSASLSSMLPPQEGIGIAIGPPGLMGLIPGLRRMSRPDVEGEDDP